MLYAIFPNLSNVYYINFRHTQLHFSYSSNCVQSFSLTHQCSFWIVFKHPETSFSLDLYSLLNIYLLVKIVCIVLVLFKESLFNVNSKALETYAFLSL